jgi:poly(hydroxyalkanoate) granule-associated protein
MSTQTLQENPPSAGTDTGVVVCVTSGLHRVWLAGLGGAAFLGEGASEIFRTLVHKGEALETKGKEGTKAARERAEHAVAQIESQVRLVSDQVRAALQSERPDVPGVLKRLGVPSRDEVESLKKQLTEVIAKLDELSKTQHPETTPPQ